MNALEAYSVANPYGKTSECAKFTITDTADGFYFTDIATVGRTYTLGFWARSDAAGSITAAGETFATTTAWTRCVATFEAEEVNVGLLFDIAGSYYIFEAQLELGSKSTDWSPAPEDVDTDIDSVRSDLNQTIETQQTEIITAASGIIMSALESYVETSDYDEFKSTVDTELEVLAGEIAMKFSSTTEQITAVDGNMNAKFSELYKYITFNENGITIGNGESGIELELDNDGIAFKKNGVQFGFWDGADFYTGNIVVEVNERAQLGAFAFVPRSDGSLQFLKVGG